MTGKEKCSLLRNIRTQLATDNNIPYTPEICTHDGDCRGTCSACEEEVKLLTSQIAQRKRLGDNIAWDCASITSGMNSAIAMNFQPYEDDIIFGRFLELPRSVVKKSRLNSEDIKAYPLIGIERLRINSDGPGIRSLIAVHGCPLHCKYCINPASSSMEEWEPYKVDEVCETVKSDAIYYRSTNGGITFGGGEPLMYPQFINEVAKLLPQALNKWCQTSLNVPFANLVKCEASIDHFAVDIKALNEEIYRRYTGGELRPVLENLAWLANKRGKDAITIRIPLIPGYTDQADQERAVDFFKKQGYQNIQTLTYTTDIY